MLSRFHRKIGSLLGLFAIVMATLAPTVSHAMAESRSANGVPDTLCTAQAESSGRQDKSDSHSLAGHIQACGYCSLLAHVPVIPTLSAPFAAVVWSIQHRVATHYKSVRRIAPLTAAQPRAPPVSS